MDELIDEANADTNDDSDDDSGGFAGGLDFLEEDPVGDWLTLSNEPAPAGLTPAEMDIVEFSRQGNEWTIRLVGDLTSKLAEFKKLGAQVIIRTADGNINSTAILQMGEDGTFELMPNGDPALKLGEASFEGDRFVFTIDPSDLPEGTTAEAALRGTLTDSLDDMAVDETAAVPAR